MDKYTIGSFGPECGDAVRSLVLADGFEFELAHVRLTNGELITSENIHALPSPMTVTFLNGDLEEIISFIFPRNTEMAREVLGLVYAQMILDLAHLIENGQDEMIPVLDGMISRIDRPDDALREALAMTATNGDPA